MSVPAEAKVCVAGSKISAEPRGADPSGAAGEEEFAVCEQGGGVLLACRAHGAGRGGEGRVGGATGVELGAGQPGESIEAAGEEDLAAGEQGGSVVETGGAHGEGLHPEGAAGVELSRAERDAVGALAAGDEDAPVREECGGGGLAGVDEGWSSWRR